MVNGIKLDDISPISPDLGKSATQKTAPVAPVEASSVTVTNQMKDLVNLVSCSEDSAQSQAKALAEIKQSIQNKTYHIDLDALSDKMISEGVI